VANRPRARIAAIVPLLILLAGAGLEARVLHVPADYPTIRAAVNHASDGDTVLVDDGTYLETDIHVARAITIRSTHRYGAVIYGSGRAGRAIFRVMAPARIEGFVLKGAACGILQRGSPDVAWEGRDLAIFDCFAAVSINAEEGTVGSAVLRNVVAAGPRGVADASALSTNDARGFDIERCLLMDYQVALVGYDHLSFRVRDSVALDCGSLATEMTRYEPVPPATSRIELTADVRGIKTSALADPRRLRAFREFLRKLILEPRSEDTEEPEVDRANRRSLMSLVMAKVEAGAGDLRGAAAEFESARADGERAGNNEFVWQALRGLAGIEMRNGARDAGLERDKEAIEFLDRWLRDVPSSISMVAFLEDKAPAYEEVIAALVDRHRAGLPGRPGEEAFYYAEKLKSLSRLLIPAQADRRREATGPGAAAAVKAEAGRRIAAAQRRLQDPNLGAEEKTRLVSLLESAEEDFFAGLAQEEKGRRRQGHPFPLDYQAVRGRLGGRAIISYVLGERDSFVFLATENGLECARSAPTAEIAAKVDPYLRLLQLHGDRSYRGAVASHLVFRTLFGPLADEVRDLRGRIIIVPDGLLSYIPFETLIPDDVTGGGGRGRSWRFWGEIAAISYATSATTALAGPGWDLRGGMPGAMADAVLVVGSADAIKCDNRSENRKQFFPPLAHVATEIRRVARAFNGREVKVLLGPDAGEGAFKRAGLEGCGIIHLAAHGVIDDANWWRSALLLGPDDGSGEDGFLTALEIGELDIRAHLVVLSACATGIGSFFKGEGIKGLSGAFWRAGAECLVVSLWNVDDEATSVFMGEFYRRLARGDRPAAALSGTKAWMIEAGYLNPFYWAPFVMIGNAG
jgi:CHAT domain-containing protein